MINGSYFYQLFGLRTGYVYQYTGLETTHDAITQQFCSAVDNHGISTIVTEVEGITVILTPVAVEDPDFTLVAHAEAPPEPSLIDANAAPESNPV